MRNSGQAQLHVVTSDRASLGLYGLVGQSDAMRHVFGRIERLARSPIPLLLLGETGTGKDVAARAIHQLFGSSRPYVAVNCAAIPKELVESELFGHEAGSFTGATRRHTGLLTRANGGTLFLDEIAELSPSVQAKLLRALDGEFRPVGGDRTLSSRFRLIAATNRDLHELVERKRFRLDLLHRLGAARITLPPLRARLDDLPLLASEFLAQLRVIRGGHGPDQMTPAALRYCAAHDWPGNIRQLRHVIEAAASVSAGATVELEDIQEFLAPATAPAGRAEIATLAEVVDHAEMEAIRRALSLAGGDRGQAAALLGISPSTLYRRLSALGL
jgi:DNA-binding NtrC family response regulator